MTRFARIEDGRVAEIITLPDDVSPADAFHEEIAATLVECADTSVVEESTYANGGFGSPPPFVPRPPSTISDRQFAQQAAVQGLISDDEALAWVASGTIPPEMLTLIGALPLDQQFPAKMMLAGATSFELAHPLTVQLTAAFGWSDAQRDAFWTAAAAL